MDCPTWTQALEPMDDLLQGAHVDDHCACGQLLPWDDPCTSAKSSVYILGVPAPCTHPDRRQPAALLPLFAL